MQTVLIPQQVSKTLAHDISFEYFRLQNGNKALSISISSEKGIVPKEAIASLKDFILWTEPVKENLLEENEDIDNWDLTITYPSISKTKLKAVCYLTQDDERPCLSNMLVDSYSKLNYLLYTGQNNTLKTKLAKRCNGVIKLIRYEFTFYNTGSNLSHVRIESFYDADRVNNVQSSLPIQSVKGALTFPDRNLLIATQDPQVNILFQQMWEYEQSLGIFLSNT